MKSFPVMFSLTAADLQNSTLAFIRVIRNPTLDHASRWEKFQERLKQDPEHQRFLRRCETEGWSVTADSNASPASDS
jgi:hypothetical protein